jgi:hypothetical protein
MAMIGNPKRVAWFFIGLAMLGLGGYLATACFFLYTIKSDPDLRGAAYWAEWLNQVKRAPVGLVYIAIFGSIALVGAVQMIRAIMGRPH